MERPRDNEGRLFIGNGLCAVGAWGRLILPLFVRSSLALRSDSGTILVGAHETDSCLVAYDREFARQLAADARRRRIAEEATDPAAHHVRARRIFGFVEEAALDARGRIALPPMLRRRARIGDAALLVGAGGGFEIWSPHAALASGDPLLAELAAFHLHAQHAA